MHVREAHPGERLPAHRSAGQKRVHARLFRADDALPWPMLVDDLHGTVHRAYGLPSVELALLDVEGHVAFRGLFPNGRSLMRALDALEAQGGRGVVHRALDRVPHLAGPIAYGWEAVRRAGPGAARDLALTVPPAAALLWLGDRLHARPPGLPEPRGG